MNLRWKAACGAALWLGVACLTARGQGSVSEIAMKVLLAPEEAVKTEAAWTVEHADLAEACEHLAPFEQAGPQTLEFQPAAPSQISVSARRGGGAPDHWIFVNSGGASYSGRVRLPGAKGVAVYTILWATEGVKCGAQSAKAGETLVEITLPAKSVAALRPLVSFGGGKKFEADVTRATDEGGTVTLEFKMDSAAAAALKKVGATLFLPARSQLLHVHANGRGALIFAPLEGVDKIRPIPFEVGKLSASNRITAEYLLPLWANLTLDRLKQFPFFKVSNGLSRPKTWICLDDEATDSDKKAAKRLADAFAAPGAQPPVPALPVITRAQADSDSGGPAGGGPNRISIGPRGSLLFPHFGFKPSEHLYVSAAGALLCWAEDPDGYQVLYLVGKTEADRMRLVRRLIFLCKQAGAIK